MVRCPHGVWEMRWVMHISFGGKEVEKMIMGLRSIMGSPRRRENKLIKAVKWNEERANKGRLEKFRWILKPANGLPSD